MNIDKVMGNCWIAYSIGLYATGHWIAGLVANAFALLLLIGN
jgi:hypothetical protein